MNGRTSSPATPTQLAVDWLNRLGRSRSSNTIATGLHEPVSVQQSRICTDVNCTMTAYDGETSVIAFRITLGRFDASTVFTATVETIGYDAPVVLNFETSLPLKPSESRHLATALYDELRRFLGGPVCEEIIWVRWVELDFRPWVATPLVPTSAEAVIAHLRACRDSGDAPITRGWTEGLIGDTSKLGDINV